MTAPTINPASVQQLAGLPPLPVQRAEESTGTYSNLGLLLPARETVEGGPDLPPPSTLPFDPWAISRELWWR